MCAILRGIAQEIVDLRQLDQETSTPVAKVTLDASTSQL